MDQRTGIVLETLYKISQIAAQALDLPSLWEPLFEVVLKTLKVDAGTLMTLEGDFLVRRVAIGMGQEIMKEPPIPSEKGGISWGVVKSFRPTVATDLAKAKIASKTLAAEMHSLVTVPMITRGQVVGVMSVFTRKERNFTQEDVDLFQTIANQAAMAIVSIRSAEILKENRKRLAELGALNEISKSIATLFDFEETLFSIIALVARVLGADKGAIILFDHQARLLRVVKPAFGLSDYQVRDFRTRTDEGATGEAFCKGLPVMANVLSLDNQKIFERAGIANVRSTIAAPLKVKSQTLGVIQIFSEKEKNFAGQDLKLLGMLASQAAVVVNSSSMYREIKEEQKKAESLLFSIGEGVLAVDRNGKIILLNRAAEKITGYLEEEVKGNTVSEALGLWNKEKKVIAENDSPIEKVLQDGKPLTIEEVYLKRRDSTLFPSFLSVATTRDADDKIIGAIVVFRDITGELEVEQMKQELISIATHELRMPITGIKGYLSMILEGDAGEINSETRGMILEILKINQRLADLVDDLLNVGRIEQGRMEIKTKPMDLEKLIEEVVGELQVQAKGGNLELKFAKSEVPQVLADSERTRQVLTNLIGNALKYTENGSVKVSAEKKEKDIVVYVKDTGVGMSQEDQKKLFEKFYRIKNEKTRQISGTGLGLWITKQLVEKMGGKIWFESVEGKGSTFSFSLPLA